MASSSSDSASASASASASFRQPKHEVFLSFRGEDTRNNFLYHLYEAFRRKGIGTYADFKELPRGEVISHALLQAIEESMISIIVFSQNYATSSWCLDELSKIMKCWDSRRQLVVPIFYLVNPSDVRKQTGSFGTAFVEHEKNRIDKVQGWKLALTRAGSLSGFTLTGDEPEPIVIEEIVHDVLNKLNRLSKRDYKGLIGIDPPTEQIKSLLCIGGDQGVRIIGIWGMGGIGKTTLAQVVYDEISAQFDSCYFLANVRERSKSHSDVIALRDKLLSKLLNEENLHIDTPMIVSTFIKNRLCRKRVLVVLDDVNDLEQLEILGINHEHFGFGSRIIVTSKDKQVLTNRTGEELIYEVKELSYNDSLQLFSLFAFKQNHPVDDFKGLSNSFLEYTKGVPLALKVLGSTLHKKSMADWESALEGLKQRLDPKIQDVLKISYDGLQVPEQNIFLDIACFFKDYRRDRVTKILDGSHAGAAHFRISKLIDKCLLNVTNENWLGMHDLIQEMGRNVVLDQSPYPEERNRLWIPDEVCQLLESGEGTKSIQGMLLDQSQIGEIQLHPGAFARMRRLRIIKFYGEGGKLVPLDPGLESLPNELRYFHWEYCMLKSLPSKFRPEKLVELRLPNSKVEQLWNGKQNLVNLKVLDLLDCKNLTRIPDLSAATNIEALDLKDCTKLKSLPESICKLKSLARLHLSRTAIEEVPSSISELESLSHWSMEDCTNLKSLPNSIGKLKSLETLNLDGCSNLEHFPEILQTMGCLFYLHLRRTGIKVLRPWNIFGLGNLVFLKELHLSGTDIVEIPEGIKQHSNLSCLYLTCCKSLKSLPELPPLLKYLIAQGCTSLERVSKFCSGFSKRDSKSGGAGYERHDEYHFMFNNCFNLDRDAVNNIVASTQLKIQGMAIEFPVEAIKRIPCNQDQGVFSCFPGSEIPETFENRSTNSSITVQLSPPYSSERFLGFVLCIVVDFKHHQEGNFFVDYEFRCGDHHKVGSNRPWPTEMEKFKGMESNHVIVLFHAFRSGIVETSRDKHFDEASFDFSVRFFNFERKIKERIEVQKCGVNVLYVDVVRSNDEVVESSSNRRSDGVDEGNRCDASMSEPNSALGPNLLPWNCDVNNRDLEGSVMEEDANDEEGLGDDPTTTRRARLKRRFGSDEEEEPDPQRPRYSH